MSRILTRQDTAANWASANPVLARGEAGLDLTSGNRKVGDGVTAWNGLPYRDDAAGLPRVLARGGAWTCSIEGVTATGVITLKAIGPAPATTVHTMSWDPATGAVTVDGLPMATKAYVDGALDNALVVGGVILR
jgi:hypothetical protein